MPRLLRSPKFVGGLAITMLLAMAGPAGAAEATLRVGTAAGGPGDLVFVQVNLDTQGVGATAYQVVLSYDGAVLTNPVVTWGGAAPTGWSQSSHSPVPGDTRVIALDTTARGTVINGEVFRVQWRIAVDAPAGPIPIQAAVAKVVDGNSTSFSVRSGGGSILVAGQPPQESQAVEEPTGPFEEEPSDKAPFQPSLPSVPEKPRESIPGPVEPASRRSVSSPRKPSSFTTDSHRSWFWFLKEEKK